MVSLRLLGLAQDGQVLTQPQPVPPGIVSRSATSKLVGYSLRTFSGRLLKGHHAEANPFAWPSTMQQAVNFEHGCLFFAGALFGGGLKPKETSCLGTERGSEQAEAQARAADEASHQKQREAGGLGLWRLQATCGAKPLPQGRSTSEFQ